PDTIHRRQRRRLHCRNLGSSRKSNGTAFFERRRNRCDCRVDIKHVRCLRGAQNDQRRNRQKRSPEHLYETSMRVDRQIIKKPIKVKRSLAAPSLWNVVSLNYCFTIVLLYDLTFKLASSMETP